MFQDRHIPCGECPYISGRDSGEYQKLGVPIHAFKGGESEIGYRIEDKDARCYGNKGFPVIVGQREIDFIEFHKIKFLVSRYKCSKTVPVCDR